MHIITSSQHAELTPSQKAYAEEKAGKLTRYNDRIQEIEIVFTDNKGRHGVEMIVNAEHRQIFVAKVDDAPTQEAGVDGCVEKLKHQLSDHHHKVKNRKHPDNQQLPR